jgi:hypothetical protein
MKAKNYSELAQILAIKKGVKVSNYYGIEYSENWVYIPRIYNNNPNKAKIRVLKQGDNVKNCLKITFDQDKISKKEIELLINSNIRIIKNNLHGSCQTFLRCNDLLQILTGIIGKNGLATQEARNLLNVEL